jgi:hypothetical protein
MAKIVQQRFNFYIKRSVYFFADLHMDFKSPIEYS